MILFATVAKKCNPPHLSRGGLLLVEAIEAFRGEFERYRNMQQVHSAGPEGETWFVPTIGRPVQRLAPEAGAIKKSRRAYLSRSHSMRPVPGIRKARSGKLAGAARSPLPIRQRP